MIDFFVSYAREDAEFARALVARLTDSGWNVWIDEKDIPPSVPWMAEIQRAIDESMMVVALESVYWLASEACHIEVDLAELARVPITRIPPDVHRLDELVAHAVEHYRELPTPRATALRAAASAAIWSAAGKKKSLLFRGRQLTATRKTLAAAPEYFSGTAKAFVTESARSATQRWIIGLAVGFVAPILVVGTWVSWQITDSVDERVATSVADASEFADRRTYGDWNIYAGIERSLTEDSGSYEHYHQLFSFLSERTPSQWDAIPVTEFGPTAAESPDGMKSATADGAGVTITASGGGTRRLSASSAVSSLAWSPDSRWIAVSTTNGAEVISTDNAQSIELRGGSGETKAVRWTDAQNLMVGGTTGTGTWQVFDGRPVAALDGVRFGTTNGDSLYTVDEAGVISRTDTTSETSAVLPWTMPEGATPTAMEASATEVIVAFIAEHPFLHAINLVDDSSRDIPLPGCNPIGMSLAPTESAAYLACLEPSVNETRVDLLDGSVTSRPAQQEQLAYGVRALNHTVLWGGSFGGVFHSDLDLTPRGMLTTGAGCGEPIRKFVGGFDGPMVFPIGDATGSFACATRLDSSGATEVKRLIFMATDGHAVPDAATSADGSLIAYGLSDGQIRVFTTANLEPIYFAQVMPDQVRTVSFSPDNRTLAAVGIDGEVVAVPISTPTSETNVAAMRAEAKSILQQAFDWGIYTSTIDPSGGGR